MTTVGTSRAIVARWLAVALLLAAGTAAAQVSGGPIRPGDVLQMAVPGRPDLDRTLTVDGAGNVDIPQVGEVRVAALTVGEAAVLLKQRLRLIVPTLDTVELARADAGSLRIYVLGQVGHAGTLEFPGVPSLWDVVRAAGGPLPTADLRAARLIREENGRPGTVPVDLSGLLEGGDVPTVELRDGDTLVIPILAQGVSGVPAREGVKVFGAVGAPSIVAVDGPTPLIDVLMLAGAPTPEANMKHVYWVHDAESGEQARQVNVQSYLRRGDPAGNPLVYPGDTVQVTPSRPGKLSSGFTFLLASAVAVSTIYLAVRQN